MNKLMPLLIFLVLTACAPGTKAPSSEEAQILEAEQLVRYTLTDLLMTTVQEYHREQISSFLVDQGVNAAEAQRIIDAELQVLLPDQHQRLVEVLAPIYRRYYTADEIHQLLSFYQSDVARKSTEVSARIADEGRNDIMTWNARFGEALLGKIASKVEAIKE